MSGIFNRIFSYRQREGTSPYENFFTETFAAVVSNSELFSKEFAMWLFELKLENTKPIRIEIKTYKSFNKGRLTPDICVEFRNTDNMNYVAIIESKIDSRQRENQLRDYDNILVEEWSEDWSKTLVYITKYSEDVGGYEASDNIRFKKRKWSGLCKRLSKATQESHKKVGALEHELLKLMEDWHMDGIINATHLRSFKTCFDNDFDFGFGQRLAQIHYDAWIESGLENHDALTMGRNWKWATAWKGEYTSGEIEVNTHNTTITIQMGFRCNRRDREWNANVIEIPSPTVMIINRNGQEFPQPDNWEEPIAVEGWTGGQWIRQPKKGEKPSYGDSLDEYYEKFFKKAFYEIRMAIEGC